MVSRSPARGPATDEPSSVHVDPVSHLVLPRTPAADRIERLVLHVGHALSWIWLALLATLTVVNGLHNRIFLQAVGPMLGAAVSYVGRRRAATDPDGPEE